MENTSNSLIYLFQNKVYRKLWGIGFVQAIMRWMEVTGLGIFVFQLTESPFWVAMVGFLYMLPLFLFGSLLGLFSEKYQRKKIIFISYFALSIINLLLLLLTLFEFLELWHILLGTFFAGIIWAEDFPVRMGLISDEVNESFLSKAVGLDLTTSNICRIIGPFIAGIYMSSIGIEAIYISGVVFMLVGSLLGYKLKESNNSNENISDNFSSYFSNTFEGLKYIRSSNIIFPTLIITVIMNIFAFSYRNMVPVIGAESLLITPFLVGVLLSFEGIGATIASIAISLKLNIHLSNRFYFYGSIIFLIMVFLLGINDIFILSIIFMFLAGMSMASFGITQKLIIISNSDKVHRGRVLGVLAASIGTAPLGAILLGFTASTFNANLALVIFSILGLLLCLLVILKYRMFLSRDKSVKR
jgi:MFS family permease